MRGILIDPVAKSLAEVNVGRGNSAIYALLCDPDHGMTVDTFDVVELPTGDAIYIDDEGLLKDPEYFFAVNGSQPIAGRGLVLGTTSKGESADATITLADLAKQVSWPAVEFTGLEPIPEGTTTNHPVFGEMVVMGHTAKFKPADRCCQHGQANCLECVPYRC